MFNVGDLVYRSGYAGTVKFVHTGDLKGMVDVQLSAGRVTVPISELTLTQIEECLDCNNYDDVTQEDTFLQPFGDDEYICDICAEKRGIAP